MESFQIGFFQLVMYIYFSWLNSACLLMLNNILLFGHTTVYLSICLLKDILVASKS